LGSLFQALAELEIRNGAGALCTVIRSLGSTPRHATSKMLVYPNRSIIGTVGGGEMENLVITEAVQAIRDGKSRLLEYHMTDPARGDPGVCCGQVEIFVVPNQAKATLVVVGAGHVGKAVAHLAHWLGFYVAINDDRPEFCSPEAAPDADAFYPAPLAQLASQLEITPWTYLVLTTRGMMVDVQGLPALLDSPAAYIGVIGSKRRWATTRKILLESGLSAEKIDRVRSPMGLELNAETPEEIAVSIMAEIIMLRQGGDGSLMDSTKKSTRSNEHVA